MQDPTLFQPMKPHFPEQEQLKCPRCDSLNTKFCYYNNYNLSQPRHFCKNCKRYWTKGGALRNIPVGGGSRKTTKRSTATSKRSTTSSSPSPSISSAAQAPPPEPDPALVYVNPVEQNQRVLNIGGSESFSSLLASNGRFGSLFEGLNSSWSGLKMVQMGEFGESGKCDPVVNSDPGNNPGLEMQGTNGSSESFLGLQNVDWNGSHGWSDLAIYTPSSSSFQ